MKKSLTLILLFSSCFTFAQVTFTADIAPIMFEHCTKCHRQGEIGPMPLTNYQEVMANASMVEYTTSIGYMPPWRPDHTYSTFRDENVLSQDEIDKIAQWITEGMPEGNPADLPPFPEYIDGSQIGTPDLVLTMNEPYEHQGTMTDQYQVFVLPTGLTEDHDIEAIEVRADNNEICHHAILGIDTTGTAQLLDAADPEYGYTQFGGFGFDPVDQFFGAWVPGTNPMTYPPTIGKKLFANADLLIQMHYGPTSVTQTDQTSVNLFFSDDPIQRYVRTYAINPYNLDELFFIPANTVKTFHGTLQIPFDVSLIGVGPHAHLLCKSFEVYAVSPDLQDTIQMIRIPEWNFNWQGFYSYPSFIHLPAGYTVHCYATYDNTENNPFNPSSPPQWSAWGEGTEDEMYLCYIQYVPYLNGDEDIVLSAANHENVMVYKETQLFPSYPNPAAIEVNIGFSIGNSKETSLDLYDAQGRWIRTVFRSTKPVPGLYREKLNTSDLPSGTYYLKLQSGDHVSGRQLIIAH